MNDASHNVRRSSRRVPRRTVSADGNLPSKQQIMAKKRTMMMSEQNYASIDEESSTQIMMSTSQRKSTTTIRRSVSDDGTKQILSSKRTNSINGSGRTFPKRTNSSNSNSNSNGNKEKKRRSSAKTQQTAASQLQVSPACLLLTKGMLAFTAFLLLSGKNSSAALLFLMTLYVYNHQAPKGADPTPSMVSAFAVVAGVGCHFLLRYAEHSSSIMDQFLGHSLGRICGAAMAVYIFQEVMTKHKAEKQEEPIEVTVQILEGRNLVPKDTTMFGYPTTSDPYVTIHLGPQSWGKTKIIKQTLDPKWTGEEIFTKLVYPSYLGTYHTLELNMFDYDVVGSHDVSNE